MIVILAVTSLACALLPAYVFTRNLSQFRTLPKEPSDSATPTISVLVPARNEEKSIAACVQSVLDNESLELEVIVLDDDSTDATARVVSELAAQDERVRLEESVALPQGWCGKQHACAQLAKLASHHVLVFIDADVRLSSDALQRMHGQLADQKIDLLSGFPRQLTGSLCEKMLIPLMHFVLLGFLSLERMRGTRRPEFGAGCGQLFMTTRSAYEKSGGHGGIRGSLHDGLKLPRLYRRQDMVTDVFDATDVASCRMYRTAAEVWHGLKKNATEGVATWALIFPVTIILLCGQVLPFLLAIHGLVWGSLNALQWILIIAAMLLAWYPRFTSAARYRQSLLGAWLHPLSICLFLAIQWKALLETFSRRPVAWKGRPYPAG